MKRLFLVGLLVACLPIHAQQAKKPNVLFLAIDDLINKIREEGIKNSLKGKELEVFVANGPITGIERYDYKKDPFEKENLAEKPAYQQILNQQKHF
jgi:hypothetical protein